MKFAAAISDSPVTDDAVGAICDALRPQLNQTDVLLLFATADHRERLAQALDALTADLQPRAAIGCTAEGVIGEDREIERSPGIVAIAGHLPGVRIHPFHIATEDWRHLLSTPDDLLERIGHESESRAIIGFGDPWTTALNQLMPALDMLAPHCPLVGGMASGARSVGENVLVFNDQTFHEGFVGLTLSGPLSVQTVVSQGARPIGRAMVITRAHENVIEQLGGKPALVVLRDLVNSLPEREQQLLRQGLFIGRAISEYRETFGRGDFLVRNVIGVDQESGSIAMADQVRVGQTVQFHVRDAGSANEDLNLMLDQAADSGAPKATLLFSCNGRGTRLFEAPHHDITVARSKFPRSPVAGFFAAGEIGPVGGRNFIHGHTASFALIRDKSSP